MKIEAVDFFYLSMPVVTDAGDGSQDALLVRVAAGGHVGWGECEASPLASIAAYVCAHVAWRLQAGARRGARQAASMSPADIAALAATVEMECMDLLQAAHTLSGIEMALWDLLGQKRGAPVYRAARLQEGLSETALCLAALWRHAGRRRSPAAGKPRARPAFAPSNAAGARSAAARLKEDRDQLRRRAKAWARTACC